MIRLLGKVCALKIDFGIKIEKIKSVTITCNFVFIIWFLTIGFGVKVGLNKLTDQKTA
jgi:hypothetical protein